MCNKPEWEEAIEGTLLYKRVQFGIELYKLLVKICKSLKLPKCIVRSFERKIVQGQYYIIEIKQSFIRDIVHTNRCNKQDGYICDNRCGECGWHKEGKK